MLLFRGSEVYQTDKAPEALDELKTNMINWVTDLSARGLHVASEPFLRTGRSVGPGGTVTDGLYGLPEDIIGGCTIVLADDIDGAVSIATACPILDTNAMIEVRAIQSI